MVNPAYLRRDGKGLACIHMGGFEPKTIITSIPLETTKFTSGIWRRGNTSRQYMQLWMMIINLRISGDGSNVFFLCQESIQAWSIQTGDVSNVELEVCMFVRSLTVDSSRVWVHSPESEPQGWDFGAPGSQLSNPPLLLSNNSKLWNKHQSRIHDTVTGRAVFQLAGRLAKPIKSQWDGHYLVAGYRSGEVLILDFNHVHA